MITHFLMLSLVTYSNTDINNYSNVLVFVKKKKKKSLFWLIQNLILKVTVVIIYEAP